ncbi:hypothetical protein [Actibacterium pelagium]|uniref:Uncharacterized protein n=1 Tax=Actibacterium pelagium TaxID=2029103 RepID=A0A917ABX0_9RHOB|nr:hypothetical protein [Actibacterium pelagium]GGE41386.1 hypothetical protein GCM10011517_06230 [Actibacterium pelagium]
MKNSIAAILVCLAAFPALAEPTYLNCKLRFAAEGEERGEEGNYKLAVDAESHSLSPNPEGPSATWLPYLEVEGHLVAHGVDDGDVISIVLNVGDGRLSGYFNDISIGLSHELVSGYCTRPIFD